MPLKIRLMRIGTKKRPFYRVVAVDERQKRTGGYLELLGTYNPLSEPKEIILKQDRIDDWIKKGAQLSDGFLRITGKLPPKPPRKPKKEKKVETPIAAPTQPPTAEEAAPAEGSQTSPESDSAPTETAAEASSSPQADEPVESETSLKEAPAPESAAQAAEVLENSAEAAIEEAKTKKGKA